MDISIIGTGALGSVMARALWVKGFTIAGLYNRTPSAMQQLADEVQAKEKGVFPTQKSRLGELVFITVPDGSIKEVAERLAALNLDFAGRHVIHCSGSKAARALGSLKQQGARTAVFHPIQTFTAAAKPADLGNIYFDVEGNESSLQMLTELARELDASCFKIAPEAKPYLHAAGVVVSNYLVALLHLTEMISKMGEIDEAQAKKALIPLAAKSLENISSADHLADALSGPIARGDAGTVDQHLELLKQDSRVFALYRQLGEITLEVAKEGDRLSPHQIEGLTNLLQTKNGPG